MNASDIQAEIVCAHEQGGGTVVLPKGTHPIACPIPMKKNVSVVGESLFGTVLAPTFAGSVFVMDMTSETPCPGFPNASVGWSNFTIDCGTQAGVTGISMINARNSVVKNIKFKGCATNVYIDRGSSHSLHTLWVEGTPTLKCGQFVFTDTTDADHVFLTHVSDVHFFNNYTTGTQPNLFYTRRGVQVIITNWTINDGWQGNSTGVVGVMLENDCQGCKVSHGVVSAVGVGVWMQNGPGPAAQPIYCNVTDVDIDQPRNAGFVMDGGGFNSFGNCKISSSGVVTNIPGIVLRGGTGNNHVHGCNVSDFNGGGVAVDMTGSTGNRITGNVFWDTTNGVMFGSGATSNLVADNLFAAVPNPITGTPGQPGNAIKNNTGHRLTANQAPAMPASGVATTNNTGYCITVYIAGGAYTVVSVNGIYTGLQSGHGSTVRLEPGDTIAIIYSIAPAWQWAPSWG